MTSGRVAVHTEFYAPEILGEGDGLYLDSNHGPRLPQRRRCVVRHGRLSLYQQALDLYDQLRQIASRDVAAPAMASRRNSVVAH